MKRTKALDALAAAKVVHEVREFAAAQGVGDGDAIARGMAAKSEEFKSVGGELYIPIKAEPTKQQG